MVHIFLTSFDRPLNEKVYSQYKSLLSSQLQEKNSRYIFWQDRHAHLFGKLLFIEVLKNVGIEANFWNYLKYNSYQRPCLTLDKYDLNISHSGNYVICVIGSEIRVGIDIEKIKNLKIENFLDVMTPCQWKRINNSKNPTREFYRYWSIKESVIKADGQGLYFPLEKLRIVDNTVHCNKKLWFVQEIEIDNAYKTALATDRETDFKIHRINYY